MEKLKSVVPNNLKRLISQSTPDDLDLTCSSLLDFCLQLPLFHQIVRDLTDPETALCSKDKNAALESKGKGNQCFSKGEYSKALNLYSQALRVAPTDADDREKNLLATIYVNRASVLHKMGHLEECVRDCNRALVISPSYSKAWYRRGKVNASLGNYEIAVQDLDVAMNLEPSLGGKRQIESEIKLILVQNKGTNRSLDKPKDNNLGVIDEPYQTELQCVSTPNKGRGMVSLFDIPQASLIHIEEPYAAIVLKHCRETHCHFCLNELPADAVPCSSCSIPLYCSQQCQEQAGGQKLKNNPASYGIHKKLSGDLEKHIADITLANVPDSNVKDFVEHRHECQGAHWASILPSDVVLAGRILMKSMERQRHFQDVSNLIGTLDLSHNYAKLPPEGKLEFHIYAIILLYCLQLSNCSEFPATGATVAQFVILLSQIKVNSIAIVRMKCLDAYGPLTQSGKLYSTVDSLTSSVEQVKVGLAIYSVGSLFNHSCRPNIHAYFLSRTLHIQVTEFVAAGYPLELSYGPQVGQWDCKDRQQFLEDQYSFKCQCSVCSELNLSDLVLNAFHCVKPNCFGVVLDSSGFQYEKQKINHFHGDYFMEPRMQVENLKYHDINKVARHLFEQSSRTIQIEPEYCLNCGAYRDLGASCARVDEAWIHIRRLQDAINSNEASPNILSNALRSLDLLRSTLHVYNKKIAQVEDNMAQAFCLVRELQPAMEHCKASIEILEKLHDPNHIVIGNELVKLSSIQLSLDDSVAADSIRRVIAIFSQYYGSHVDTVFPYLQRLKMEAGKLVN